MQKWTIQSRIQSLMVQGSYQDGIAGQGRLSAMADHRHPLAIALITANRALDLSGGR